MSGEPASDRDERLLRMTSSALLSDVQWPKLRMAMDGRVEASIGLPPYNGGLCHFTRRTTKPSSDCKDTNPRKRIFPDGCFRLPRLQVPKYGWRSGAEVCLAYRYLSAAAPKALKAYPSAGCVYWGLQRAQRQGADRCWPNMFNRQH